MGYKFTAEAFNQVLAGLQQSYKIYGPALLRSKGRFSDTDIVGYGEIQWIEDVVFNSKAIFSPKEAFYPINQTLFYFTEHESGHIPITTINGYGTRSSLFGWSVRRVLTIVSA